MRYGTEVTEPFCATASGALPSRLAIPNNPIITYRLNMGSRLSSILEPSFAPPLALLSSAPPAVGRPAAATYRLSA